MITLETLIPRVATLETRAAVEDAHRASVERRLSAIEDTLRWLLRIVLGGLIAGLLAFALQGGFGDVAPL
ncbi:MAG: hemolysin XhlA family protein [Paracoccaceae bacterium]